MGADRWIVLKAGGPGQLANASIKIKQGQVVRHPGYPVDPNVLQEFDDFKKAQAFAQQQLGAYNEKVSEGVTSMKTLAHLTAKNAKEPSMADREKAIARAKVLTETGIEDPAARIGELESELRELKELQKKKVDAEAYLDQKADTVISRVKKAVKRKQLAREDLTELVKTEESGKQRKKVLDTLKEWAKNDVIFGKLFGKK